VPRPSTLRALLFICALACFAHPSFSQSPPQTANPREETKPDPLAQYKARGHVNDFAGIIDARSQTKLAALGAKLDQQKSTQFAFVTVVSLEGVPIKEFATQLANRWGLGHKDTNRGILILLVKDEHQYRISVGLGLESVLTDEKCAALGKEMVPMLQKGEYGEALLHLATRIADVVRHQI